MIYLKIEEVDGKPVMVLDGAALAALGAALDDSLLFSGNTVTVQRASGEMGRTFSWKVERPNDHTSDSVAT